MIVFALIVVAAVLAGIAELQAEGRSLTGWAVLFLAAALLWGRFQ